VHEETGRGRVTDPESQAGADWPIELAYVRRASVPDAVIGTADGPPVHLLFVTEWLESVSFHLSWPWLAGDVHCGLRQAYHLADATGNACPLIDSRVMPLAGRMNEVTFFDTRSLSGPQTLSLRLRAQLGVPIPIDFGG
jgi:hypothetical protein